MTPKPQNDLLDSKKRLSGRRKAVTFVIGIACSDGIVLCADSLEGDGYKKKYVKKLTSYNVGEEWGVAWGCAGTGDVIDKFSDRVRSGLGNKNYNRADIELTLEAAMTFIKRDYPSERMDVVAASFGPLLEKTLYFGSVGVGCLSPKSDYAIAGMDTTLSEFIMRNTYSRLIPCDEAARLAVLVTSLMKDYADGVGGPTAVVSYRNGDSSFTTWDAAAIAAIETDLSSEDVGWAVCEYWSSKHPRSMARHAQVVRKAFHGSE